MLPGPGYILSCLILTGRDCIILFCGGGKAKYARSSITWNLVI